MSCLLLLPLPLPRRWFTAKEAIPFDYTGSSSMEKAEDKSIYMADNILQFKACQVPEKLSLNFLCSNDVLVGS